jgi:predicted transcriptional regulator YheO
MEKNIIEVLRGAADVIAAQFGPDTEVVIHDFTQDLDHTIVYIVNGHVTGRTIGDGPTKSFLRDLTENNNFQKRPRTISITDDGRTIRSSTVNYCNDDGTLACAMCINQDITSLVALENAFQSMTKDKYFETSIQQEAEDTGSISIQDVMESLITEGIHKIGMPPDQMNREAKIAFIKFLNERGVFKIQKSGQEVCSLLNISKFTLYNYMEEAKK